MGARQRRIERIRKAMPFTAELKAYERAVDANWWSRRDSAPPRELWYVTPISVNNRGGEPVEESNYRVAEKRVEDAAGMDLDCRLDLWPGGAIKTLMVRADDALAIREVQRVVWALQEYPVLDEDDLAEEEWEQDHPTSGECYSERGDDCSCDVGERRRAVKYHSCLIEFATALYAPEDVEEGTEIDVEASEFWCGYCEKWQATDAYMILLDGRTIWRDRQERERNGQDGMF